MKPHVLYLGAVATFVLGFAIGADATDRTNGQIASAPILAATIILLALSLAIEKPKKP